MSALINAGEGIDIDIHLRRENRSRAIDKVAQRIRLNRTKLKGMQDTSTDYEELANSIQAGYFIKNGIANYNEDLFYLSVFITVSAQTYEELLWRKRQMTDMLKSMDMQVSECHFQQEAALRSVLPFLQCNPGLEKKSRRERTHQRGGFHLPLLQFRDVGRQRGAAGGQPEQQLPVHCGPVQQQGPQERQPGAPGHLRGGEDLYHAAAGPADADARHPKLYCGAHQGHEFRRACNHIGGEFIKIAPGSPHCINVMEIRHVTSPEMELIDEIAYGEMDSLLARKIQQLMTFFGLLIPDMTNEEEQMLDEALIKTYRDFGITHDNDSVYGDKSQFPPKMKRMPVLGDLHKHLLENPMTQRSGSHCQPVCHRVGQSFNRQTNVDLSNKYIVLDLSELKGKLAPRGHVHRFGLCVGPDQSGPHPAESHLHR